ncbi:MAG: putative sugar nucleotidyl transferase [Candidatus Latescibacterota bacterium]
MTHLVVFEQYAEDHGPLARTRPVFELRCGSMSLGERLVRRYGPERVFHQVRPPLALVHRHVLDERGQVAVVNDLAAALSDGVLLVDGAALATPSASLPDPGGPDEMALIPEVVDHRADAQGRLTPVYREGGRLLYLRLGRATAAELLGRAGPDLSRLLEEARRTPAVGVRWLEEGQVPVATYPWLLLERNAEALAWDYGDYRDRPRPQAALDPSVVFLSHGRRLPGAGLGAGRGGAVYLGRNSAVGAFVVFDTGAGPILAEEGVTVQSHCHLQGPAWIGRGCTLWAFTDLKEGCSLGPSCRVCGQLEEVIFQGYMHKFHVGFVGHSYLGEGVNLGDQTVTSNLRNDRAAVPVQLGPQTQRQINTGRRYLGSLIGDGVSTGTNTNLTTGAVVEPLSSIVSAAATPKYISGLLHAGRHLPWPFPAAYGAMRILVEERLGRPLPAGHEALFRHVYAGLRASRRALS